MATTKAIVLDGVRRYECAICRKTFSKSYNLRAHQRKHTGERPFKCPYPGCGRDFSWKSSLTSHKQTHLRQASRGGQYGGGAYQVARQEQELIQNEQFQRLSQAQQAQVLLAMQCVRQEQEQQQMQMGGFGGTGMQRYQQSGQRMNQEQQSGLQFMSGANEMSNLQQSQQALPANTQAQQWQQREQQRLQEMQQHHQNQLRQHQQNELLQHQQNQLRQQQQQQQQQQLQRYQQSQASVPQQGGARTEPESFYSTEIDKLDMQTHHMNGNTNANVTNNIMQPRRNAVELPPQVQATRENQSKNGVWLNGVTEGAKWSSPRQQQDDVNGKGKTEFAVPAPLSLYQDQSIEQMDIDSTPNVSNGTKMSMFTDMEEEGADGFSLPNSAKLGEGIDGKKVTPKDPPREIDLGDFFTERDDVNTSRPLSFGGGLTPGIKYSPFPVSTPFALTRGTTPLCRLPGAGFGGIGTSMVSPMESPAFRPLTPLTLNYWPQSPFPLLAKSASPSKMITRQIDSMRDS